MDNLNNLSDDELDKLFRQSAEERNIEFEEEAWQKMNLFLDQKQPLSKLSNRIRNTIIVLALLFLGSIGLYFTINTKDIAHQLSLTNTISKEDISEQANTTGPKQLEIANGNEKENLEKNISSNPIVEINPSEKLALKKNGLKSDLIIPDSKVEKSDQLNIKPKIIANNTNAKKPNPNIVNAETLSSDQHKKKTKLTEESESGFSKEKFNTKIEANNIKAEKIKTVHANAKLHRTPSESTLVETDIIEKKEIISFKPQSENMPAEKSQNIVYNSKISNTQNKKDINNTITNSKSDLNSINPLNQIVEIKSGSTNTNPENELLMVPMQLMAFNFMKPITKIRFIDPKFEVDINPLNLPIPELKQDPFFRKGLSLRLAVSPDLSTIGSNQIQKIGSDWGGLVEYRFGKRFVFQTGLIKSTKKYAAYPTQYKWIWGWSATKLMGVDATCKMLDIPLNIRYDAIFNAKSRLFTSIGFTNYIMQKEVYKYDYADNSNPNIKWRQWSGKTGTYKMSNLNISIGFEKQVSRSLTLQVEPFMKSPLKSIGFGKVPLITYGMMFSVNYPLNYLTKKQ